MAPRHPVIPPEVNGVLGIFFGRPNTEPQQVFGCRTGVAKCDQQKHLWSKSPKFLILFRFITYIFDKYINIYIYIHLCMANIVIRYFHFVFTFLVFAWSSRCLKLETFRNGGMCVLPRCKKPSGKVPVKT